MPRNNATPSTWTCKGCGTIIGGVDPRQQGSLWCFHAGPGKEPVATPDWMDPTEDPRYKKDGA